MSDLQRILVNQLVDLENKEFPPSAGIGQETLALHDDILREMYTQMLQRVEKLGFTVVRVTTGVFTEVKL